MAAGDRYRSILDPFWNSINFDSAESFAATFPTVPKEVGWLYAAHVCQADVCNGGFRQFFHNSTGVFAPEAVEAFTAIGQPRTGEIVQRALSLLGRPYPRDRAIQWIALESITAGRIFCSLDQEFYALLRSEAGGFENPANRYSQLMEDKAELHQMIRRELKKSAEEERS